MRLSTRIALAVGATVPVLVLATGWLLLRLVAADLHDQQDTHLRERAVAVAKDARSLLRASAADRSAAVEQARERRVFTSALDVGVRLIGPEETFTGGPQPAADVALPARARVPVTLRADGRSWRILSIRVTGARPGVRGTLWLFASDTAADTQVRLVRRRAVTVALLAAPLSGLLAWAVATRASTPLRRLQRRASGLDPRSSSTRLDHTPTRIAEVDDLAHTLQTVLARYDEQALRTAEALATARSFASAASHELRTPLMSMQTNLEILTEHPELAGPDRDEVLHDLSREHARLLGVLVMLRDLGRGDLVEADAFGPVDLADLVEASTEEQRRRHPHARVVSLRAGAARARLGGGTAEPGGQPARQRPGPRAHGRAAPAGRGDLARERRRRAPRRRRPGPWHPARAAHRGLRTLPPPTGQPRLRPRADPGRPADRPAPGRDPGTGPAHGCGYPRRGHPAAERRHRGHGGHASASAQLDDHDRRPATRIPQRRLLAFPARGQSPLNVEEFVMPSTRKTVISVVSLVAAGSLFGAAGAATADAATPAPSGTPTGDGAAALCKRAPKIDRRIDRILTRLRADASQRGSIARLEQRVANAKSAGHTQIETYLNDRLTARRSLVPTLETRQKDLADVEKWCGAHDNGRTN